MKLMIREARERAGYSQKDLAEKLGVAPNTFHGYESGKHDPKSELLVQIAELCGVSTDYLLGREQRPRDTEQPGVRNTAAPARTSGVRDGRREAGSLSPEARRLAKCYDGLDRYGRHLLDAVAAAERRRTEAQAGRAPAEPADSAEPRTKIIPLFAASFAAGPGEPDFGNMFEQYEVDRQVKADFAIRVHGDSMEPWLHDGQTALGRHGVPADGDVAAVWIDGEYFVKQWLRDNYGNLYLRSLNRARADMDRTVWVSGDNDVRCIGVIDLPERPPAAL